MRCRNKFTKDVERVTVGLLHESVAKRQTVLTNGAPGVRLHQREKLKAAESAQTEPRHAGLAVRPGQHVSERMVGAHLGLAERGDNDHGQRLIGMRIR